MKIRFAPLLLAFALLVGRRLLAAGRLAVDVDHVALAELE